MPSVDYSKIKIVAWRFGRAFVWGFVMSLAVVVSTVELDDMNRAFLVSALTGALAAGGQAAWKAIRLWFASDNYKSLLHKLPL